MVRRRPSAVRVRPIVGDSTRTVGESVQRVGTALAVLSVPVVLGALAMLDAPTVPAMLRAPPGALGGLELALHLGVHGVLVGLWVLGLGLLVAGLFDG